MTPADVDVQTDPGRVLDPSRWRSGIGFRPSNAHAVLAATLVLVAPNVLFALHLRGWAEAPMLLGAAVTVALALRPVPDGSVLARPVAPLRLVACLASAVALLALGGEGHLVFSNSDWLWRDAVLSDLARAPFPPSSVVDGRALVLRAPLGMYMLPALAASAARLGWGHAALLVQNAALLTLVLYVMATLSGRGGAAVCAVFVSFSGLDILGEMLVGLPGDALPSHIEAWAHGLQYSSVVTQLFWVPNHALPSYWLALLAWACRRGDVPLGLLVASAAACLFWSPFAVIGTLPLGFYLFARAPRTALASAAFWAGLVAAACFVPVALYLQAGAAAVPRGLLVTKPGWWMPVAVFLAIEIPQAALVLSAWPRLTRDVRELGAVSICFLVVLPTVQFGMNNDLVMRASIPALTLLAVAFAQALLVSRGPGRTGILAGSTLLVVGAVTPLMEVVRALAFPPIAISDCDLVTVWKKLEPNNPDLANYLAPPSPTLDGLFGALAAPSLAVQPRAVCWPDLPFDPRLGVHRLSNDQLRRSRGDRGPPGL